MLRINVLGGLSATSDRSPAGASIQPRRLAVLALLTVSGERGLTREELLAFLWPDTDDERGRHALTQALYALRRDLGAEDLFLGQQELRLNPDLVTSDWDDFYRALRTDRPDRAIELYTGPFLDRFQLGRAGAFEHWVEEQRRRGAQGFEQALDAAARKAVGRGDYPAAIALLRRRAEADPLDPRVTTRLMEALAANGEVVGALQHARAYEARVKEELGLAPDPAVTSLVSRLRAQANRPAGRNGSDRETQPTPGDGAGSSAGHGPGHSSAGDPAPVTAPPAPSVPAAPPAGWPRWWVGAAVILVAAAGLLAASWLRPSLGAFGHRSRPVIAVGWISDYGTKARSNLGPAIGDMLATNLSRGTGYRVISSGRMLELMRQLRGTGDSSDAMARAARQAGASQLIDGALYNLAPDRFRLDLRRVDLATGSVIDAYKVEGGDLFALVDSGTAGLVPDLGGAPPSGSVAEVSTHSLAAYQLYQAGLERYYAGDIPTAGQRFHDALEIDSTFAMAAFYYARSIVSGPSTEPLHWLQRAVSLSSFANDRDRLVIQAEWALYNRSPSLSAIADTLRIRYPEEVDGYWYAGLAAASQGRYLESRPYWRRLLALDSLGVRAPPGPRCLMCEAYSVLSTMYFAVDSVDQAYAIIHEWVRRQPGNPQAWRELAQVYARQRQRDAALRAIGVADSLEPGSLNNRRELYSIRSILGEFVELEGLFRNEMTSGLYVYRDRATWDLAIILRQLGRLDEALALARAYRRTVNEPLLPGAAPYDALLEGQIRFERGEYASAAALFDSIAIGQRVVMDSSLRFGSRIWAWTHAADAYAMLGDTARLRRLADTMEVLGRQVALARDQRLYAHVRGLLAKLQGRDAEAIDWFRRAIDSPTFGFTRSNYELAGLLLRSGRPAEAVRLLTAAVRGGTMGSNLYITATELENRLGRAYQTIGVRDSALYYYRQVAEYWAGADPPFQPRRDSVLAAIALLDRGP